MKTTTITVILEHEGMIDRDVAVKHLLSHIEEIEQSEYKQIDDMIEFSLKYKTLVQMAKEQYRGLGKTTKLAQKAKELDAILLVPSQHQAKLLINEGYENVLSVSDIDFIGGLRFSRGFIVDEGVHPSVIAAMCQNHELLGGFSRV